VPWAAIHKRLPYNHDPTRQARSTLLPHQVGTVADRRRHYVRSMGVPRSPHAPLEFMLAEPRLADAVPRSLPVTEEARARPVGFPLSDPGDVPTSTEEAAASAAYHARKRRHADMELHGPAQPGSANPGSPVGAAPDVPVGPAAFPAPGGRWDEERHDDYPGMAGAEFGDGWPAAAVDGAGGAGRGPGDRMDGVVGRGAGVWDDRAWPAAIHGDNRSLAAAGRDDLMRRTDGGQGRERDAHAGGHWDAAPPHDGGRYPTGGAGAAAGSPRDASTGRLWDAEPQKDGGSYPTGGAGAAAGSHRDAHDGRHWGSESRREDREYNADAAGTGTGGPRFARSDAGRDNDGPPPALLWLGIVGPVATPVPGQPDVAYDWWLSLLWEPPAPMKATAWRDSLTSRKVVALFGHDRAVNWAEVGPPELTAALVEYARIGLAGVVTPCLETPRTRAKRFHAALRRVLRGAGRMFASTAAATKGIALAA